MARAVLFCRSLLVGHPVGVHPRGVLDGASLPQVRGGGSSDLARAVTLGYLTGGVALTLVLPRFGCRQICDVLRSPAGFVAWLVFTLHLWVPRYDPVHYIVKGVRSATTPLALRSAPGGTGVHVVPAPARVLVLRHPHG